MSVLYLEEDQIDGTTSASLRCGSYSVFVFRLLLQTATQNHRGSLHEFICLVIEKSFPLDVTSS